jgi:deoxyribodipyrimidine photo-lyase
MERFHSLNASTYSTGPILYWMQRDQRVHDNWALLKAQEEAEKLGVPCIVVFSLVKSFLGATRRHYDFMLKGLQEVEQELQKYNIPFVLLEGSASETIPEFCEKEKVGMIVTDFNPLKIKKQWTDEILKKVNVPFLEVDAHNVIPCWITSEKQELAARTIRGKIHRKLKEYCKEFPAVQKQTKPWKEWKNNWDIHLEINENIKPVSWLTPGEKAAKQMLKLFIEQKLKRYTYIRGDPTRDGQSDLSPYFHFGQLSPQRALLDILKTTSRSVDQIIDPEKNNAKGESIAAFIEEGIIRRELADNFCYYNENYDSLKGAPQWAQDSLQKHATDEREYIYTKEQLEHAKTHDPYWNAAQREMIQRGKMHNYMRMYWAKKILEWTPSPKDALEIAIYLNDTYELDGRDPNGYVGCLWSIAGVHDRPWFEREIFGKIRYMNDKGLERKFDIKKYVATTEQQTL